MLRHLLNLTDDQKQLEAYSVLFNFILDEPSKILIKRVGIEAIVRGIGGPIIVGHASVTSRSEGE